MSKVYGKFDLSAGVQILENVGGSGLSGLIIGNESGLTLTITLQGANVQRTLYPSTVDFFAIPQDINWSGLLQIDPAANLNNVPTWPGSYVQVDTVGLGERVNGFYPLSLPRNTNIGNTVQTAVVNSLQNDGNPANTQIIETTQSGSTGSNGFMDNSGNFYIAQYVGGVYSKLLQVIANAATAVKLGLLNKTVEILGNLLVDQNLVVTGGKIGIVAAGDLFDASNGTDVYIKAPAAGGRVFFIANGNVVGAVSSANNGCFETMDNTLTAQPTLYTTAGNHTVLQMANNAGGKLFINDAAGVNLFSVDTSGNVRARGTVTASVVP